jgi:hypothetical protein
VWGPDIFASKVASDKPYTQWSTAEKIQVSYLRRMAGVGDGCIEVLMRDFARCPIMHHWVILAARWFMALKCMSSDRLAHCAWVADIELMLEGCEGCWTYKLLHTMALLGVLDRASIWDAQGDIIIDKQGVMLLQLLPKNIKHALKNRMALRWAALQPDPRTAPSTGVEMCTHAAWVLKLTGGSDGGGVPKHLKLCVSFVVLQCLARLRLGWHDLQIRRGRLHSPQTDRSRHKRLCRLCSVDDAAFHAQRSGPVCVEDLKHFVLDCPAYKHVRLRYCDVFGSATAARTNMCEIFDCDHQDQLAHAVYTMTKFREHCLSLPVGADVHVEIVQQAVEEDVELVRIR